MSLIPLPLFYMTRKAENAAHLFTLLGFCAKGNLPIELLPSADQPFAGLSDFRRYLSVDAAVALESGRVEQILQTSPAILGLCGRRLTRPINDGMLDHLQTKAEPMTCFIRIQSAAVISKLDSWTIVIKKMNQTEPTMPIPTPQFLFNRSTGAASMKPVCSFRSNETCVTILPAALGNQPIYHVFKAVK